MEVRVALDTNRLTDLFQGDAALAEWLGTCEEVWIPLVVLAEIKAGFLGGTQQRRNEALLQALLAKPTVGVLLPARETAEHYARLFVQLKRAGTPIPDNDLWIASLVSGARSGADHSRPALREHSADAAPLTGVLS
jgi:tRNA(fMet)-specific endonuclease VapC